MILAIEKTRFYGVTSQESLWNRYKNLWWFYDEVWFHGVLLKDDFGTLITRQNSTCVIAFSKTSHPFVGTETNSIFFRQFWNLSNLCHLSLERELLFVWSGCSKQKYLALPYHSGQRKYIGILSHSHSS